MNKLCYSLIICGTAKKVAAFHSIVAEQQNQLEILFSTNNTLEAFNQAMQSSKEVIFLNRSNTLHQSYGNQPLSFIMLTESVEIRNERRLAIWQKLPFPLNPIQCLSTLENCMEALHERKVELDHNLDTTNTSLLKRKISIPIGNGICFIDTQELIFLEADSNYTVLYTQKDKLTVCRTLSEFETRLEPLDFIRVHHKYMVNMNKVFRYDKSKNGGMLALEGGFSVPVSARKQKGFLEHFSG